jgi:hypothetical protein
MPIITRYLASSSRRFKEYNHWEAIQWYVERWTREEADLRVVCEDGDSVYSHRALFGLSSVSYRDILLPGEQSPMACLSVTVSLATVRTWSAS